MKGTERRIAPIAAISAAHATSPTRKKRHASRSAFSSEHDEPEMVASDP